MVRIILICVALAFGAVANAAFGQDVLVRFEDNVPSETIDRIVEQVGGEVVNTMLGGRLVQVRVPPTATSTEIMDAYAATAGVRYVEPVRDVTVEQ